MTVDAADLTAAPESRCAARVLLFDAAVPAAGGPVRPAGDCGEVG